MSKVKVEVLVSVTDRVVTAEVITRGDEFAPGRRLLAHGEARCRRDDVFSRKIGTQIALGRALVDLGQQVERDGLSRVVSNEELVRVVAVLREAEESEPADLAPSLVGMRARIAIDG